MGTEPREGGTAARRAERDRASGAGPGTSKKKSHEKSSRARVNSENERRESVTSELEERRDFLLASIDDLNRQHDKGEVSDEDFALLLDDYTARAAETIRAIESPGRFEAPSGSSGGKSRLGATALFVGLVAVVGVVAGVMVARSSGTVPAESNMSVAGGSASDDQASGPVAELMQTAQSRIADAQTSLRAGDGATAATAFREALQAFDEILAIEPNNVQAMTYRGWLLHNLAVQTDGTTAAELDAEALEWLDRAVAIDPGYPDARVFRAVLLDGAGRQTEALADLDSIDMTSVPPALTQLIESRRASIEAKLAQGGAGQAGNGDTGGTGAAGDVSQSDGAGDVEGGT